MQEQKQPIQSPAQNENTPLPEQTAPSGASPSATPPPSPGETKGAPVKLTEIEARVLGCLLEKEITTPDYYPLSLNALVAACNQKSNRAPEMQLDETTVVKALDNMRYEHKLVWQVTVQGSRVPKYKHNIMGRWKLSAAELAVLCELMVRGPQTLGELRTHGERLFKFSSIEEVETTLRELTTWQDGPFVVKLPREPGRKEPRYAHLLAGEVRVESAAQYADPEPARLRVLADNERLDKAEKEITTMKAEIEMLKAQFAEFRKQLE